MYCRGVIMTDVVTPSTSVPQPLLGFSSALSVCLWVLLAVPADSSPGHHLLLFWLHTCGSSSHNQAVFPLRFSSHSSPDGRRLWTVGMASWPLSKILLFYKWSCPTCLTRVSLFPSSMLLSASVRTYLDLFSPFSSPQSQSIPLYSQSCPAYPVLCVWIHYLPLRS